MNLPPELTNTKQWVIANKAKVPFNPNTRQPASVTKPETWGSFEEALAARDTAFPHIGYVLTLEDGLTFIDLDTPQNPEQEARHARVLAAFEGTYMEISQSGRGLHIVAKGTAKQSIKRDKVEIYSAQRYMICTGKSFPEGETPADIVDRPEFILGYHFFQTFKGWWLRTGACLGIKSVSAAFFLIQIPVIGRNIFIRSVHLHRCWATDLTIV